MYLSEDIQNKWKPVLEHEDLPKIGDAHKRSVTAVLLENTEKALRESGRGQGNFLTEAAPANHTGDDIDNFDPVLISLVRRAMPNLIAYDICGVQPMTGPTGLIFAMRAKYGAQSNTSTETFYNEVNTAYSSVTAGANTLGDKHVGGVPDVSNNAATAHTTSVLQCLQLKQKLLVLLVTQHSQKWLSLSRKLA